MGALRRTPWATQSDLTTLHSLLFDDPTSLSSIQGGVARLGLYLSSPSCPLFFPLLHGLMTASLLPYPPPPGPGYAAAVLTSRLTYAMSLIRFINGLIDPLQSGAYARPILHLAKSLGIPEELVQMRHQATHEDLPSLEVLKEGVDRCIGYLRERAMGPLVFPDSGAGTSSEVGLEQAKEEFIQQLSPLLTQYKKLMKLYFRERTTKSSTTTTASGSKVNTNTSWDGARGLRSLLRTIETLIQDPSPSPTSPPLSNETKRTLISSLLLSPGFLLPSSKSSSSSGKKRSAGVTRDESMKGGIPRLPLPSGRIWAPLLRLIGGRLDDRDENEEEGMDGQGDEDDDGMGGREKVGEGTEQGTLAAALVMRCIELLRVDSESAYDQSIIVGHGLGLGPGAATGTGDVDTDMDMNADFLNVPSDLSTPLLLPTRSISLQANDLHTQTESTRIITASYLIWLWTSSPNDDAENGNGDGGMWLTDGERRGLGRVMMRWMGGEIGLGSVRGGYFGLSNVCEALNGVDDAITHFNSLAQAGAGKYANKRNVDIEGEGDPEGLDALKEMEARLRQVEARLTVTTAETQGKTAKTVGMDISAVPESTIAPGWKMADERWKECPIGVWRV